MSDDDDDPPSSPYQEPKLKKARHQWQVKGSSSSSQSVEDPQPCCSRNVSTADESSPAGNESEDERRSPCRMVIAWRTQQLAKAVFDNTINTMIENMSFPLPEFGNIMDSYSTARSNNNLEDQAVRMAIRSHGLQKPCSCSRQRVTPHVPCYIPFHHRTDSSIFGGPSTSSVAIRQQDSVEQDILSEAVNVAILNKGLGASHGSI
uniref:Uncharacterized protein n=1 Tax=Lygus hesperus TaxID=30085 RepID=A0A0K8SVZ3_LYGHE